MGAEICVRIGCGWICYVHMQDWWITDAEKDADDVWMMEWKCPRGLDTGEVVCMFKHYFGDNRKRENLCVTRVLGVRICSDMRCRRRIGTARKKTWTDLISKQPVGMEYYQVHYLQVFIVFETFQTRVGIISSKDKLLMCLDNKIHISTVNLKYIYTRVSISGQSHLHMSKKYQSKVLSQTGSIYS